MTTISEEIAKANALLKAGNIKVAIGQTGKMLILRATLPPKPNSIKDKAHQQEIYLGCPATSTGIQQAVSKAKLLRGQLDLGKFVWDDWADTRKEKSQSTSDLIKQFEENYWARIEKTQVALETWDNCHDELKKLPDQDQPLSVDKIITTIKKTNPDSSTRKKVCIYLAKFAKFCNLPESDIKKILSFKGNYTSKSVNPRDLPTDKQIMEWRDAIENTGWQWIFGMMACYGLRNHEVFFANLDQFPVVSITEGKTGERYIYPLFPEWAEQWNLRAKILPNRASFDNKSHTELGRTVSNWICYQKTLGIFSKNFSAYDLRHCYARRTFEFGLTPEWAAKLMGHSESVHSNTYRAWIDKNTYLKAFHSIIFRENRPLPPT